MPTLFRTHPEWSDMLDQIGDIITDRMASVDGQIAALAPVEPSAALEAVAGRADAAVATHAERSRDLPEVASATIHAIANHLDAADAAAKSWRADAGRLRAYLATRLPARV